MYHIERVHEWLQGKTIYPIYMEISPSGACNHRCIFCGLDFMKYQPRYLDWDILKQRLNELGALGLKSIMYGGEGEPLLHKKIAEIIQHAKHCGIDNAITTNGVLFKESLAEQILPYTEWVKISINAGTPETYAKIHGTNPEDFQRVMDNLSKASNLRKSLAISCVLGMQMILLPENKHEAFSLAQLAREIGMDYFVVKPYSQHLMSNTEIYKHMIYDMDIPFIEELESLTTDSFSVILRLSTIEKWNQKIRTYTNCQALPFWSYMDAGGNIWGCSCYLGDDRFLYGNIYTTPFKDIWEGQKRQESLDFVQNHLNTKVCRVNCRMDEINRYLWELKSPPAHVNFI